MPTKPESATEKQSSPEGQHLKLPLGVKLLHRFGGLQSRINCLSFDPLGRILAIGSDDGFVRLLDASSGKVLRLLEGHRAKVWSVAFDPVGQTLASGSADNTIKLWELRSGGLSQTLKGHKDEVY